MVVFENETLRTTANLPHLTTCDGTDCNDSAAFAGRGSYNDDTLTVRNCTPLTDTRSPAPR
jgi:hypothetical protein